MLLSCMRDLMALDASDVDAVRVVLDECLMALIDPALWLWVTGLTLICGLVGMAIGWAKGRVLAGLVWGLALGPIGWIIVALSRSKLPECPECGRPNGARARVCRHCGVDFLRLAQRTARSGFKDDRGQAGW
jgi:ribosomal protein L40E